MASAPITVAALTVAGLVLATFAHAVSRSDPQPEPRSLLQKAYDREVETAAGSERCTLYHARFGGQRAQLVAVTKGSVRNYVVMEVGKRDPSMRALRSNWLRANYGDSEHLWLGDYISADSALARARDLCPLARRCWPGEPDCVPAGQSLTPARLFFDRPPPTHGM